MRRFNVAGIGLGLGLGVGCGEPPPVKHAPLPAEASAGFGPYTLSAGRAILSALTTGDVPGHFRCSSGQDLRATAGEEKAKFAALGGMVEVVMAGFKVSLSAPGKKGVAAEAQDVPSDRMTAFVHARSLVGPNGKVTWVDANGYLAGMEQPHENRAAIGRMVAPVRTGLDEALAGLSSDACTLHLMTAEDLDALPYPLQKDERDVMLSEMKTIARQLPRACHGARGGQAPWEVHVHHMDAVFRGNGMLARVRARTKIEGDSVCLLPVEVMKVVSGS